jgi:hypothetical protein
VPPEQLMLASLLQAFSGFALGGCCLNNFTKTYCNQPEISFWLGKTENVPSAVVFRKLIIRR